MGDVGRLSDLELGHGDLVVIVVDFEPGDRFGTNLDFGEYLFVVGRRKIGHKRHLSSGDPNDVAGF